MAPIRLRHPKGVTTVDVAVDSDSATVQDLQKIIFSDTEIPPSQQEVKLGYPPRPLTLISELPISSLGLQRGDQLVVTDKGDGGHRVSAAGSGIGPTLGGVPISPTRTSVKPPSASGTAPKPQPAAVPAPKKPSTTSSAPPKPQPAARPAPPPQPAPTLSRTQSSSGAVETVRTDSGILVHRVVPDDNSCLFASIGIIFEQDQSASLKLRKLAADTIRQDEIQYDEALLGQPRESYMTAIQNPLTWGGGIELSIFSTHYKTEITSIDVESGRTDRFGEGSGHANRCFVLYSGVHYDAVSRAPMADAVGVPEFHETLFSVDDGAAMAGALELATKLREQRKFTNTSTFDLLCEICRQGLKGEKGAREHAKETGHTTFGEYRV
ncbi:OTU-domain-containing protein [Auriculariales sp. MPI-PUGE-AT-0066]|nr:OTU-domain-containing protein [Auriculariales sp. MPI-PUGE-AT-0066]